MLRGVDHIVLAVADLDAARALYESLGFTVTPTAHHPFGTKNALVQLDDSFLELLAVEDARLMPQVAAGDFSFPRFNMGFLEKRQGASMLVLRSGDRAADLEAFQTLGLRTFAPFDFGRKAEMPDGSLVEVGFALGFVQDPLMVETGFFVCQHKHSPELFWKANYQAHRNGARHLNSVLFVAHNPSDHHEFLGGFSGQRVMRSTSAGVVIEVDGCDLEVLTPSAIKAFFNLDIPHDMPEEGGILALRIAVDLDRTRSILDDAGLSYTVHNGEVILQAEAVAGVGLIFCQASE
ncbi:VOC family protein [Cohaesibacter haloalkalitolerans]|uniref:VOC family protein n=1 Tax=Cohaesibacter haloalkalitolerans TaxID=1162980 RepID=UPI000E64624A|nr:VOC family protein [Cohaesibacter haloalkalitolerans]